MATYGTVVTNERLSPSMTRIVLGGPGLDDFASTPFTDQYVNALFVPDGADYAAPFDVDEARERPAEERPRGRRLTVRRWDETDRLLTLDVVAHGDVGFAGRWAQHATEGDILQFLGPGGGYRPDPAADACLLVGDESALPAIAASLEVLAPTVHAIVRVVVDSPDHEVDDLPHPDGADVRWLHRSTAATPEDVLVESVRELDWPDGTVDVFVHGEAGETRSVRKFLLAERGIDKSAASISPYWRRDHTDEAWRAVKAQWIAEQDADV